VGAGTGFDPLSHFIQGEPHGDANFLFDAGFEKKKASQKFDNPQIKVKGRIILSNAHKRSQFPFCKEAKTVV
jgi:hypothetical protein